MTDSADLPWDPEQVPLYEEMEGEYIEVKKDGLAAPEALPAETLTMQPSQTAPILPAFRPYTPEELEAINVVRRLKKLPVLTMEQIRKREQEWETL